MDNQQPSSCKMEKVQRLVVRRKIQAIGI